MILKGPEETRSFAEQLALGLPLNTVIALYGDLGAGKTTFVQGLVRGLGGAQEMVHSPTFTYMHLYPTQPPLHHFDLYRLVKCDDFFAMGFEEAFESGGIIAIEWPERLAAHLPSHRLEIRLAYAGNSQRSLEMQWI